MTFQDPMQGRDIIGGPEAGALFARKGEASPVGGRPARRRTITMRTPPTERPARLTGDLLTRDRAELPQPANTSALDQIQATIETTNETAPRRTSAAFTNAPVMIVPVMAPIMGPVIGAAAILPPREDAKCLSTRRAPTVIRGPIRPTSAHLANRPDVRRAGVKRTTLRFDDVLRARLARFAASETLSVQALLTRALERFLPAISVQRSGMPGATGPGDASAETTARGGRRSVRFDPHLYWRLKTAAAKHKHSMQSIMVGALMAYLDELEATGRVQDGAEMTSAGNDAVSGPIAGPTAGVTIVDRRPVRFLGTQHAA